MRELVVEIEGLIPETVTVALKADLTISADLERECMRCASQYGYYAVLAEKAEARHERAKAHFERFKAETEDALIKERGRAAFKAVKDITRELLKLPKYVAYQNKLSEYKEHAGMLKAIAKAFEHKKDLIQTCNANRRSEMKG